MQRVYRQTKRRVREKTDTECYRVGWQQLSELPVELKLFKMSRKKKIHVVSIQAEKWPPQQGGGFCPPARHPHQQCWSCRAALGCLGPQRADGWVNPRRKVAPACLDTHKNFHKGMSH